MKLWVKYLFDIILFIGVLSSSAIAAPTVRFLPEIEVINETATATIEISDVSATDNIKGYFLRIDYDDTILSNPKLVVEGTLSQNYFHKVEKHINSDAKRFERKENIGKYSIGIWLDDSLLEKAIEKDTLLKVKFEISTKLRHNQTLLSFIQPEVKSYIFGYYPAEDYAFQKLDNVQFVSSVFGYTYDFNQDGKMDIADAIILLKVFTADETANLTVTIDDKDNIFGYLIYILQAMTTI